MLTYYLIYFIPAVVAMLKSGEMQRPRFAWTLFAILLIILLGFRMSGGDWYNYLKLYEGMQFVTLEEAVSARDFGYKLISYVMYQWDLGFAAVTLICAMISVTGLMVFLRQQVNPWLGLAVAVPYLYIVVFMGYMRQGVALGLVMWAITYLDRGKFWHYVAFVGLAVTFHMSAVLMIAFGIFQRKKGRLFNISAVVVIAAGFWAAYVGDATERLYVNYVQAGMISEGALIRVLLNAVPALLLLLLRKRWRDEFGDYGFWSIIAYVSLAAIPLVGLASTAVDRVALYFLPIQIVVFARLPYLLRHVFPPQLTAFMILGFYFTVLTVWLNFGNFSMWWVPYRNYLTSWMFG
ncbi:EpsG family protein [Thiomicrolovo sp. ZZH C-3]